MSRDRGGMVWAIRASFLEYLADLGDGEGTADAPAERRGEAFVFPAHPDLPDRFLGSVTLTGHQGFLHVVIAEPALERDGAEGQLTIADPDWPGRRMTLARFAVGPADPSGSWVAHDLTLTADGSDLFFRVYAEGDHLDNVVVESGTGSDLLTTTSSRHPGTTDQETS